MKKALIIRIGAIGDVVETTGLADALLKQGWQVDYLTGKIPAELLITNPNINNVYIFEKKTYSYILNLGLKLRKEKYDLILNLQPSLRLKTLSFLAGGKKVSNYKKTYKYHAVENFFETGKRIMPELILDKNINLYIPESIKEKMNSKLNNKIKICFNIGANSSRQGRKWCIPYWSELAKKLFEKYDTEIFIIGGNEDKENANKLLELEPRLKNFAGKTTLMETAALLSISNLMISGDTGPLHIASASGIKCLGLYGCCSVSRSGPYGENHKTISSQLSCAPCDKRKCRFTNKKEDDTPCMREIKPQKVLDLVDIILSHK